MSLLLHVVVCVYCFLFVCFWVELVSIETFIRGTFCFTAKHVSLHLFFFFLFSASLEMSHKEMFVLFHFPDPPLTTENNS